MSVLISRMAMPGEGQYWFRLSVNAAGKAEVECTHFDWPGEPFSAVEVQDIMAIEKNGPINGKKVPAVCGECPHFDPNMIGCKHGSIERPAGSAGTRPVACPLHVATIKVQEHDEATLTEGEAYSIAQHIDETLLRTIREDAEIDGLQWLRNIVHGYEKLCRYSGYVGLTEDTANEGSSET